MAIKTYEEQLEEVQAAITAILNGSQSYSIEGRSMTKADLSTLYEMQSQLMPLYRNEAAGRTGKKVSYVEVG